MLETRREKFVVLGGGPMALALFGFLLWPDSDPDVEPTNQQAAIGPPKAAPAVRVEPPAATTSPTPAPAPSAAAAEPHSGLRLHGILGGGRGGGSAIFRVGEGSQRLVEVGREVAAGVRLAAVARDHVLLEMASGTFKLHLNGGEPAPAGTRTVPPAGASQALAAAGQPLDARQYRSGLAPRRVNGRTTGYAMRPDAPLPLLRRAGLQPGDVLVAVNGQTFDSEEKVLELSREIAGSYEAEFEFERNGRRMRATLPVNPRRN